MERGLKLEAEARLAYSLEKGIEFQPALVECKEYPYLSASLDAWSEDGQIAEIKCPSKEDHALACNGEIPKKYIPQLCHQLFVTGAPSVDYVSFDGDRIAIVTYQRDERLIRDIMGAAHRFWIYVVEDVEPKEEWPHPDFDTRIPILNDPEIVKEAEWNFMLRREVELLEKRLQDSNELILSKCNLPRAKVGKITIVTSHRAGSIDYSKVPSLKDVDLEQYRKPGTVTRSIRRS